MKMMRKNTLISQGRGGVDAYNASDDGFLERCVVHCERGLCARLQLRVCAQKAGWPLTRVIKMGTLAKAATATVGIHFFPLRANVLRTENADSS